LNIVNGDTVWSQATRLPVWGSPATDGKQVVFGLGNGRLDQSVGPVEERAGAVQCLDAVTGVPTWEVRVPDGVLARPALDAEHVYFTSRDHYCYCVERRKGQMLW